VKTCKKCSAAIIDRTRSKYCLAHRGEPQRPKPVPYVRIYGARK
jgi:hypothetical protein